MTTLRLCFPNWQGGANPNYIHGSSILNAIVPASKEAVTRQVPVADPSQAELTVENGIVEQSVLIQQQEAARQIIAEASPDRIITFGGDCLVSQAPFDYLHGKYGKDLGIIWVDTHPDISRPEHYKNAHAMVLGNLLGAKDEALSGMVENPYDESQVLFVGLNIDGLLPYEKEILDGSQMSILSPEALKKKPTAVTDWIAENGFKQAVVHFDIDVLDPKDFHSQLTNKPNFGPVSFALGSMTLEEAGGLMAQVQKQADIVGLTFAEYLPWDLIRLKDFMAGLDIFQD